jgi:hypothetical protein
MHAMIRAFTVLSSMQGMVEYGATSGAAATVIAGLRRTWNRAVTAGSGRTLLVVAILAAVLVLWSLASRPR